MAFTYTEVRNEHKEEMFERFTKSELIFKKYKEEGEECFDPTRFLIEFDCDKYFELLKDWKSKNEKKYLEENPYLNFSPHRHKKILGKPRPTIRG